MSESAFGVEHGEVFAKKQKKQASVERKAGATIVPGWHGAIVGRPGRKLGAAASEIGHSAVGGLGGGLAGGAAGAAISRGRQVPTVVGAQLGSIGGSIAGGIRSANVNTRKGRYKKEYNG